MWAAQSSSAVKAELCAKEAEGVPGCLFVSVPGCLWYVPDQHLWHSSLISSCCVTSKGRPLSLVI